MAAMIASGPASSMAMPHVIGQSAELAQGLAAIEEASKHFASADPALRAHGEGVFLQLRQDPHAIEHALYALQSTADPFVQFQSLNIIIENLSSLSLRNPSPGLASLTTLRDLLLAYSFARGDHAALLEQSAGPSSTSWPQYVRVKAFQTFAAVQVRLLALELQHSRDEQRGFASLIENYATFIIANVIDVASSSRESVKSNGASGDATTFARFTTSMGLLSALLDDANGSNSQTLQQGGPSLRRHEKSRAIDVTGLSAMQRRWVKAATQTTLLDRALSTTVQALSEMLSGQQTTTVPPAMVSLVAVLEHCLRWTFLHEPYAGLESEASLAHLSSLLSNDPVQDDDGQDEAGEFHIATSRVRLAPRQIPSTFSTFLSADLVRLLTHMHSLCAQLSASSNRDAAMCIHRLRRCMLLAARFVENAQGSSVRSEDLDTTRAVALLESCDAIRSEIENRTYGTLQTETCKASLLVLQLYDEMYNSFAANRAAFDVIGIDRCVKSLTLETARAFAMAFGPQTRGDEDDEISSLAEEAVMHALSAWHVFALACPEACSALSSGVVSPYILQRLDGAAASIDGNDDTSEFGEEKLQDHETFNEQLVVLATLARMGFLPEVLDLLETQLNNLTHSFSSFYESDGPLSISPQELNHLEAQWERLHWLTLICGHVVSDDNAGETGCIAREIAGLDHTQQQVVISIITTLSLRLVGMLLKAGPDRPQSPQVLQTLLWFSARWIPSYLLAPAPSPVIAQTFCGDHGQNVLALTIRNLFLAMRAWVADADVVFQIAAVLRSISLSEHTKAGILTLQEFGDLVDAILHGLGSLPATTHKSVVSALVGCIYATSAGPLAEQVFTRVTQSIEERLSNVVHQDNFANAHVYQRVDVIEQVHNALDLFDGLAASIQPRSRRAVYTFLSRFFDTFASLARMYADHSEVVTAILRIMRDLVRSMDLGFGVDDDMRRGLIHGISQLLEILDANALIGDSPSTALEEQIPFEGLCLALDMLSDLACAEEGEEHVSADAKYAPLSDSRAIDVCLLGFSRLVPVFHGVVLDVARVREAMANLQSTIFLSSSDRVVGLLAHSASRHDGPGAHAFVQCTQALCLTMQFDETTAVLDALGAVNALAQAVVGVLSADIAHNASLTSAKEVATKTLLSIADVLLRTMLIEPVTPSMLAQCTSVLRIVLRAASETGGGALMQAHFEHFCAATPLTTTRASETMARKALHDSASNETRRRREALAHAVSRVVGQLLSQQSSDAATDTMYDPRRPLSADGAVADNIVATARDMAWHGRSDILMR